MYKNIYMQPINIFAHPDIVHQISCQITAMGYGSIWKIWIQLSKLTASMTVIFPQNRHNMANHLRTIMQKYPSSWDFTELSRNPNITIHDVQLYSSSAWVTDRLLRNPNITPEVVMNSTTPFLNPQKILAYMDTLSCNTNLTIEQIMAHPELPWNWDHISYYCKNITMNDVIDSSALHGSIDPIPWSWAKLSHNPGITLNDIISHPEIPWDYCYMSYNPNITFDYVLKNLDKNWYWNALSFHPNITLYDIMDHPSLPWVSFYISQNPNFTIQVLMYLQKNKHAMPIIKKVKRRWFEISRSPGITFNDVINHPEFPWDYGGLSSNPNITFDDVINNAWPNGHGINWKFDYLSCNTFANAKK